MALTARAIQTPHTSGYLMLGTRFLLALLPLILIHPEASAQASGPERDRDEIVATVQRFFDTMATRDVDGAGQVLLPGGSLVSVRTQDGNVVVRTSPHQAYLDGLASRQADVLERMWDPEVRVHGPVATLWTRYDFFRNGAFSHCGVDAFDLVRTESGWKISGGVYTVETADCPPSPLGSPG
jgi:hypothetical protein